MEKVGVLGAGTWGLALARLLCLNGHDVTCWSPFENEIEQLKQNHGSARLPGMVLPACIELTSELEKAVEQKTMIVCAVPSPVLRQTIENAAPWLDKDMILVDVAKGIEKGTLLPLSQVILDVVKQKDKHIKGVVALTGPTHAEEVSLDLPTAIVAACEEEALALRVQNAFMTPNFRVYTNTDMRAAELCGALKNVIAIAVGIALGLGYGDNTKAALMTRGLAEIIRLGQKLGCDSATFYGLCGMGDLIVTCTSIHSRNLRFGQLLGQGMESDAALKEIGMVVEGLNALDAAMALSEQTDTEMPIVHAVYAVIHHGASAEDAVAVLMQRQKKSE